MIRSANGGAQKPLHELDPAARAAQTGDPMGAFDLTQKPLPPLLRQQRSCP